MNKSTHLLINSIARTNKGYSTPSNFSIQLNRTISNCKSFSLASLHLPNVFYNISSRDTHIAVNNNFMDIPSGNYNLNELMLTLQAAIRVHVPSCTISFNEILSRVEITAGVIFSVEFSEVICKRLGLVYGEFSGQLFYAGEFPPYIYDLNIYILLDIGSSVYTNHVNVSSCTFCIMNNRNKGEYISFDARTQFNADVLYNEPILSNMSIRVIGEDGYDLEMLGEWEMMIRFNH